MYLILSTKVVHVKYTPFFPIKRYNSPNNIKFLQDKNYFMVKLL